MRAPIVSKLQSAECAHVHSHVSLDLPELSTPTCCAIVCRDVNAYVNYTLRPAMQSYMTPSISHPGKLASWQGIQDARALSLEPA